MEKIKKLEVKGAIVANDTKWIYDYLEMDAVCPKEVKKFIDSLNGEDLLIEVNSGGGDLFAGSEIYTEIRNYNGKVKVCCVGIAGSAASPLLTISESEITPMGLVMIHNTAGGARGDYHVMEKESEILQKANQAIAAGYLEKTGLSETELLALMDKETWMTAQEAVELGFCDRIMENQNQNAKKGPTIQNQSRPIILNSMQGLNERIIEKIRNLLCDSLENNLIANKETRINQKEGTRMEQDEKTWIVNVEQLEQGYPELVEKIKNDAMEQGVLKERSRIKGIDEIAANLTKEMVLEAKYSNPIQAEVLALEAIKANAAIGNQTLEHMIKEMETSGAKEVKVTANSGGAEGIEEIRAAKESKIKALAEKLKRK